MPKLSIITVNYNNAAGLEKTMHSVFSQIFTGYEYIIIDGGSTDNSKELIVKDASKLAWWVSEKDNGVYDAMNKGITVATGDYCMFLNSGDYLTDNNVLLNFDKAPAGNEADIYYGNIHLEDAGKQIKPHTYPSAMTLDFWKNYTINHQATFIKSTLFKEAGLYELTYSLAADYAFFLKCFIYGKQFVHINNELVYYTLDGASSVQQEIYQQQMKQAWNDIVPGYLNNLFVENKVHHSFMKHRIMAMAKKLQEKYNRLKGIFN